MEKKYRKIALVLALFIVILVFFSLTSCNNRVKTPNEIIDLPQNYTISQAEKDGFILLNSNLNHRNVVIENFISDFYSKDKQLVTIDENYIINLYEIENYNIKLFSYNLKNITIIYQIEVFDRVMKKEYNDKVELYLYNSTGRGLTSSIDKHIVYVYKNDWIKNYTIEVIKLCFTVKCGKFNCIRY